MATVARIVATGRANIVSRLKGNGSAEPNHIHWGEDGGTTLVLGDGNTALGAPRSEARVAGTSSIQQTTTAGDTYRVVGTLTVDDVGGAAIEEVGLFDAAGAGSPPSGGALFMRATFSVINLDDADSVQFTIDNQVKAPA